MKKPYHSTLSHFPPFYLAPQHDLFNVVFLSAFKSKILYKTAHSGIKCDWRQCVAGSIITAGKIKQKTNHTLAYFWNFPEFS